MSALDAALVEALGAFAARPRILVALDFDGVLAPIVPDPSKARALAGSSAALVRLAQAEGVRLALVSGRSLTDLRDRAAPPPGAVLVGSHGAEVEGQDAAPELDDEARTLLEDVVEQLGVVISEHEGTGLERKATAAVLHTRQAEPDIAAEATAAALTGPATLAGVRAMRGKEVVELSVVTADKGSAVRALRERLGVQVVLYAGDDTTDEDAFAVLDIDAGDLGIKVGEGESAAQWRLEGPGEITDLLTRLADLRG